MRKQGFTLTELLVSMVMFVLLLVIAIPCVTNIINKSCQKAYMHNLGLLKSAAKNYTLRNNLKVNDGAQRIIFMTQLIEDGVINDILDPKTKESCTGYVIVNNGNEIYDFIPYMECGENYTSENYGATDTTPPVLNVLGDLVVTLNLGETYIDAGVTATDNVDGDISSNVMLSNFPNVNTTGSYIINYSVEDSIGNKATATRTVSIIDTTSPVIAFTPNGNFSYSKNFDILINASDLGGLNSESLKYVLTTSDIQPELSLFVNTFTNNQTIATPVGITGSYYMWVVAKDINNNQTITRSNAFNLDNTAPVITMNGSTPINHTVGTAYTDAGATASDTHSGIAGTVDVTSTINVNALGTYTVTYNVSDNAGNAAITVVRTVNVVDTVIPTVAFGTNGNTTYAKSRSTTVTVSDANSSVNASSLKYLWNTSTTAPTEASFTTTFTNGGTISSPANVTGGYYLWILGKDTYNNTVITRTNVFNLDNTIPVITLTGNSSVTITQGTTYTDAGATASDNIDGNISANISKTGSVNTSVAGTYTLTYNVSDSAGNAATSITRTVIVEASGADTTPPVITLNGSSSMSVFVNTTYTDPGATAMDNVDGDITSRITKTGAPKMNTIGSYTVTYKVLDTAGNQTTKTRMVNVISRPPGQ